MREIGIIMWIGGAALAAYAGLAFDTSVGTTMGRVVNMDLQQKQMMMLVVGCVLFAVGAILHAISRQALAHSGQAQPEPLIDASTLPGKKSAPVARLAYARKLGIKNTDAGYEYDDEVYASVEDAIAAAMTVPDFSKIDT